MKLYKYLSSQYSDNFVKKGDLLFRNLSYFRQYEDSHRGDPLEGFHRDNPNNDIPITNLGMGNLLAKGKFSFLNSTNTDLINVFCLSKKHEDKLYEEFNCDCCIEILNPEEFIRRTRIAAKKLILLHESGLLYGDVIYYHDNSLAGFDIKNPKNLAFAKNVHYEHQNEYRLVFGYRKAFDLKQQIVANAIYDFVGEAKKGTPKEKHLFIGDLSDIINIHYI